MTSTINALDCGQQLLKTDDGWRNVVCSRPLSCQRTARRKTTLMASPPKSLSSNGQAVVIGWHRPVIRRPYRPSSSSDIVRSQTTAKDDMDVGWHRRRPHWRHNKAQLSHDDDVDGLAIVVVIFQRPRPMTSCNDEGRWWQQMTCVVVVCYVHTLEH